MKMIKTALALALFVFTLPMTAPAVDGGQPDDEVRTIEITGMDNMKYDVEEIVAEPGETIRIEFKVVSEMPPAAMKHNIAIVDLDTDLDAFVQASIAATDNDYIAPDMEEQVIANTEMIGGGETSTIEFTVPETPGEYDFVCTFPGHYQAGMVGILRVEG
ncbi:MAG: plastocyanin/azurin family copper-binding protein [Bacteroidota bacterium]